MHMCVYIYICVCVCVYRYIHRCIHIYIHIYIGKLEAYSIAVYVVTQTLTTVGYGDTSADNTAERVGYVLFFILHRVRPHLGGLSVYGCACVSVHTHMYVVVIGTCSSSSCAPSSGGTFWRRWTRSTWRWATSTAPTLRRCRAPWSSWSRWNVNGRCGCRCNVLRYVYVHIYMYVYVCIYI